MNLQNWDRIVFLGLAILCLSSCASTQKSEKHFLRKIILYNLHYRRPLQIGANPGAEPNESDFTSNPLPDQKLDCEPLPQLFASIDLAGARRCLASVNEGSAEGSKEKKFTYKLRREITPYFELDEDDDTPPCFQQTLEVLPVPREIYFQALESKNLSCFSARIPIAAEETLGINDYLHTTQLTINFPIVNVPDTDEETIMLLSTWVMTPFFNSDSQIESKVVTRSLCSTCFGGKGLLLETDPLPPFWP